MSEYILVCIASFSAALLTLFSGFGLSTILMPVFTIFFPVNIAVGLTAIIHLLNNLFRSVFVYKSANKEVIIKFGIPAIFAAFIGAYILSKLSNATFLIEYHLLNQKFQVSLISLIIGILIIIFVLFDLIPEEKFSISKKYLPFGGILSGFFGGLSGHQGAFRSIFLIKSNLSAEQFISTSIILSILVDIARISVYGLEFSIQEIRGQFLLLILAIISAFSGSYIGTHFIKKITLGTVKIIVSMLLIGIALALITGLI